VAGAVAAGLLLTGCGKKEAGAAGGKVQVVDPSAQKANMMGGAKSRQGQAPGTQSKASGPAGSSSKAPGM